MKRIVVGLLSLGIILSVWTASAMAVTVEWEKAVLDSNNTKVYLSAFYKADKTIYALSGDQLYTSVDEGRTWRLVSGSMKVYAAMVGLDMKFYALAEEKRMEMAIYCFDTGKNELQRLSIAPPGSQYLTTTITWDDGILIYTGKHRGGRTWEVSHTEDNGTNWITSVVHMIDSDGSPFTHMTEHSIIRMYSPTNYFYQVPAFSNYDKLFTSPNYQEDTLLFGIRSKNRIDHSTDGGKSWRFTSDGLDTLGPLVYIAFSIDYMSDHTLYCAEKTGNVFKSNTKTIVWRSLDMEFPKGVNLNNLVVLPNETMLAGTNKGVYVSAKVKEKEDLVQGEKDEVKTQVNHPPELDKASQGTAPISPPITTYSTRFWLGANTYSINGRQLAMDTYPYLDNDRIYVPVRFLAYGLNIMDDGIEWDNDSREVTITKGNNVVKMQEGSLFLYLNGKGILMDVAPQIDQAYRLMLPARWVAEAFGATVRWDEAHSAVIIELVE